MRPVTATLALALLILCSGYVPAAASDQYSSEFFSSFVGEWVGISDQTTDGEESEQKFFHASVTEDEPGCFTGKFSYYRYDFEKQTPIPCGEAIMTLTVQPDGTILNKVEGDGTILIQNKPKKQTHSLLEVLTPDSAKMTGRITGKIDVHGMPFGLGKNGEVYDSESEWSFEDGFLTVRQSIKTSFKVLFVSKSFHIEAFSQASRGSDVIALMKKTSIRQIKGS